MPTLPGYERGEAIGWGKESVVYAAEGDPTLVVKVIPLASADEPGLVGGRDQASFLRTVMEEKSAFAAGCTRLCEIHAYWAVGASGSVVKRRCSRSLASLIEGKVKFEPEDFQRTVESILDGLVQLKTHAGRSHGNLTASNVLIDGRHSLAECNLYLTDLADSSESPNFAADLEALGKVIYEMVRRRLVEHYDVPITDGGEWGQIFQRRAGAWLAFCNFLLDPARRGEADPLNVAVAEFRALGGRKSRRWLALPFGVSRHLKWIVAGLIALGIVLTVVWRIWVGSDRHLLNDLQRFQNEYSWFAALEASLPANVENWHKDNYLRDRVIDPLHRFKDFPEGNDLVNAVVLAKSGQIPSALKPKRDQFSKLLAIVDETHTSLKHWPAKDDLYETSKMFDKPPLGWTEDARALKSASADIDFNHDVAGQINSTLKTAQSLSGVRGQIDQLQQEAKNAENYAGDGLTTLVFAELGKGDLGSLSRRIQSVRAEDLHKISSEASNREIAFKRLRTEEPLAKMAGADFSEKLTQWQQRVASYRRIGDAKDPRSYWEEQLKRGEDGSFKSDIEREIKSLPEPLVENDRSRFESIVKKIAELLRRKGASPAPTQTAQATGGVADGYAKALQRLRAQIQVVAGVPEAIQALQIFLDETGTVQLGAPEQAFRTKMQQLQAGFSGSSTSAPPLLNGQLKPTTSTGSVTTYRLRAGLEFTFVFIQPADGGHPFFLERTELSGLLLWALTQVKHDQFGLQNPRALGPATWLMNGSTVSPVGNWKWLQADTSNDPSDSERNDLSLPANFIGPDSAKRIAQALGARLPTLAEWKTAYKMTNLRSTNENLRDLAWFKHWQTEDAYFKAGNQNHTIWPHRNSFYFQPPQTEVSDKEHASTDDGKAWFRSTDEGGAADKLSDMEGNLAEYVTSGDSVQVIGSSALAPPPPSVVADQPRDLPPGGPNLTTGWSDVGVRLALDPAGESPGAVTQLQGMKDLINREGDRVSRETISR